MRTVSRGGRVRVALYSDQVTHWMNGMIEIKKKKILAQPLSIKSDFFEHKKYAMKIVFN